MDRINEELDRLSAQGNLRQLRCGAAHGKFIDYDGRKYVNMSSNDYLGLGADTSLQEEFFRSLDPGARFVMGNPASRLMTGNSEDYDRLEEVLSSMYEFKEALVLGSGYMVNSGILPALTRKGDLILADKYVHASLIDGLRLCGCEWRRFSHNDMSHLEEVLKKCRHDFCNVWVVTESVFSMDGDVAPLRELVGLKERYDLRLYLDEAHAFGVYGQRGQGLAHLEGLDVHFDVLIATFGKALASCGAFAAVSPLVRQLLVNRMRTLIFSTALPPVNLMWTRFLLERMADFAHRREHLRKLVELLGGNAAGATHIVPVMAYENHRALEMADIFREKGYWVTPVRYPTVPKGQARVRVSLSAALDITDITKFKGIWKNIG